MSTGVVFPHQLFEQSHLISHCSTIYLIEEFLFYKQYKFHKQKIAFHRASMKFYESYLLSLGKKVFYVEANNPNHDVRELISYFKSEGIEHFEYIDTSDCWLEQRINSACKNHGVEANKNESPLFLNTSTDIEEYFSTKKRLFQTDFYKHQRIKRNVLIEPNQKPIGGKWTFDDENRLKYPKGKIAPEVQFLKSNDFYAEAIDYTDKHFSDHYGKLNPQYLFPCTFLESKTWLDEFLKKRFVEFGAYEDAIVSDELVLHHSILSPMLNVGLISPQCIIDEAIQFASCNEIPMNSLEGFIRQIMGWREFIRAVYELKGSQQRTQNYWGFKRKIPASFWNGTTGIAPIDSTIKKVLETGYCHHIERLMVLGNFMVLCEFDPDEVYRWFMELFIDAYDWVMVPNVYGMSQFADGGLMTTKPYISGSNYIMKMSDFKKGDWQPVWDGMFWRFMHIHRDFFLQNPRLGMLIKTFDKMPEEKQQAHVNVANEYILSLDN